ncbi:pyridoxamine 5'-phosphate oxidase [Nocardioides immobilis]|uniref:Pyridoxine/pyridoxamine 5'-phosphate oxidase n=1 Tax=Nocardioides immobilis TaxID=2049295 RepID=A0A417Y6E2_9ACTN|nr:pyridoxamine 5'-phosphate oxidase [Nocardioides immobilis]RHW28260.1 pyridoxamine 5'-phosphate oxidase [Nocardioides immobilis]
MPGADEPDLATLRREYGEVGLAESMADPDPLVMFRRWFSDAQAAHLHEPNAMIVATVSADGQPAARTVLLKGLTDGADGGFAFFTNTTSRKGADLAAEPRCALLFPWHPLERQVRVEGVASRLTDAEVTSYFTGRPRGSQLGAHASPQSQVVAGREELDARYAEAEARYAGGDVPVPQDWGGYRVRPETFEFWQGRQGRMHDRLRYRRTASGWVLERLAP